MMTPRFKTIALRALRQAKIKKCGHNHTCICDIVEVLDSLEKTIELRKRMSCNHIHLQWRWPFIRICRGGVCMCDINALLH